MTDHYSVNINLVNGTSVHYFLLFLVRLASESSSCLSPGFFLFSSFLLFLLRLAPGARTCLLVFFFLSGVLLLPLKRLLASARVPVGSLFLLFGLSLCLSFLLLLFLFCFFFVTLFLFFSVWVNTLFRLASEGDSCESYPDSPPLVRGKLLPRAGISSFPVTFCGRTQEL